MPQQQGSNNDLTLNRDADRGGGGVPSNTADQEEEELYANRNENRRRRSSINNNNNRYPWNHCTKFLRMLRIETNTTFFYLETVTDMFLVRALFHNFAVFLNSTLAANFRQAVRYNMDGTISCCDITYSTLVSYELFGVEGRVKKTRKKCQVSLRTMYLLPPD